MKIYRQALFILLLFICKSSSGQNYWQLAQGSTAQKNGVTKNANTYLVYTLNETALSDRLFNLGSLPAQNQIINIPLPDGSQEAFRIWESSILPPSLALKYPSIKTFTAEAVKDPTITAKIDVNAYGFHAMVFSGTTTCLIDPMEDGAPATYYVRYKKDEQRTEDDRMLCLEATHGVHIQTEDLSNAAARTINGYYHRTYRLALTCNHQYAQKVTGLKVPTKELVLSKMTTTMNRVNGIYERELSITMTFVSNEDTLIFNDSTKDPFGNINDNPSALLEKNQRYCDSLIGDANYDIGHVFSTNGGGLSSVGAVCISGSKAKSVTGSRSPMGDGFDVDYVAHEMGHEYGSDHTFNNNSSGSCAGNADPTFAFEPGSGSTIMAYAGICGTENLQPNSDAYFCASSLQQIYTFVNGAGNTCGVKTATGNKPVGMTPYTRNYAIPANTPFELEAPTATDSVTSTSITYCWEQANLGDFGQSLKNTTTSGPLFRSYTPTTSPIRVFPKMSNILGSIYDDSGDEGVKGEKLPTVSRNITFRLTMRNILNAQGCFLFPDDSVLLNVSNTGKPFLVTSQAKEGIQYLGGSEQTITWDVSKTDAAPISAANVDIYLTADSGKTWPYYLGNFPNNGSAIVTMPNPAKTIEQARVKVKPVGNVFFSINKKDFAIINYPDSVGDIKIYPSPAHSSFTILTGNKGNVETAVFDLAGRRMWEGEVNGIAVLDVSYWPRAMYIIKLIDVRKRVTTRKVVLY